MKVWIIIGTILVLLGLALFATVMTANGWNFKALSTATLETNVTPIDEDFQHLSIKTDTAHITLVATENAAARVECYEEENAKHAVTVEDGTLHVRLKNEKKWYEHIDVNFEAPQITVYLPKAAYGTLSIEGHTGDITLPKDFSFESIDIAVTTGDVTCHTSATEKMKIKASTGSIRADDIRTDLLDLSVTTGRIAVRSATCGDVTIRVSTGKTVLTDVTCHNLITRGNTGDLVLRRTTATDGFTVERTTGDVIFDASDATSLSVTTDTGDVTGTLLSEKIFVTSTDTGHVSVPKTTAGGRCEITTDTGNIKIEILKQK